MAICVVVVHRVIAQSVTARLQLMLLTSNGRYIRYNSTRISKLSIDPRERAFFVSKTNITVTKPIVIQLLDWYLQRQQSCPETIGTTEVTHSSIRISYLNQIGTSTYRNVSCVHMHQLLSVLQLLVIQISSLPTPYPETIKLNLFGTNYSRYNDRMHLLMAKIC